MTYLPIPYNLWAFVSATPRRGLLHDCTTSNIAKVHSQLYSPSVMLCPGPGRVTPQLLSQCVTPMVGTLCRDISAAEETFFRICSPQCKMRPAETRRLRVRWKWRTWRKFSPTGLCLSSGKRSWQCCDKHLTSFMCKLWHIPKHDFYTRLALLSSCFHCASVQTKPCAEYLGPSGGPECDCRKMELGCLECGRRYRYHQHTVAILDAVHSTAGTFNTSYSVKKSGILSNFPLKNVMKRVPPCWSHLFHVLGVTLSQWGVVGESGPRSVSSALCNVTMSYLAAAVHREKVIFFLRS